MTLTSCERWQSPLKSASVPFKVCRNLRCGSINCLLGEWYKAPLLPLSCAEAFLTLRNHIGHREFSLFFHKPETSRDKLQSLSLTLSMYSCLRQQKAEPTVFRGQEEPSCGAETWRCHSPELLFWIPSHYVWRLGGRKELPCMQQEYRPNLCPYDFRPFSPSVLTMVVLPANPATLPSVSTVLWDGRVWAPLLGFLKPDTVESAMGPVPTIEQQSMFHSRVWYIFIEWNTLLKKNSITSILWTTLPYAPVI